MYCRNCPRNFPRLHKLYGRLRRTSCRKTLWIYRRLAPRPVSKAIISNAIDLASMRDAKIPRLSTNSFFVWSGPNACGMRYDIFSIQPASDLGAPFSSTNQNLLTNDVPDELFVAKRAYECAGRFGINSAELVPRKVYGASTAPGCDALTNGICGQGIFLARKLDGFRFSATRTAAQKAFQ